MLRFFWSSKICLWNVDIVFSCALPEYIEEQLITTKESKELCLPERDLEHVGDEEDDKGEPHQKDDRRRAASLQLILPLHLS